MSTTPEQPSAEAPDAALAAATADDVTEAAAAPVPAADVPAAVTPAGPAPRLGKLMLILPIVLMVLAALGIGGTLLYASHQASTAPSRGPGSGQFPGGSFTPGQRPSGFPSGAFTPGQRPSGFPSGSYTPGNRPSGFPTGGRGGGQGQMGNQGLTLNGGEIAGITVCSLVFLASAGVLTWTLIKRRKTD